MFICNVSRQCRKGVTRREEISIGMNRVMRCIYDEIFMKFVLTVRA